MRCDPSGSGLGCLNSIRPLTKDRSTQFVTGLDVSLGKPALVHFKDQSHRFRRAVRIVVQGFHVRQIDDGAVVFQKSRRQRDQRVAHPKALGAGLLENKQHAFVLRHVFSPHQPDLALLLCLGQLHIQAVHTGHELRAL